MARSHEMRCLFAVQFNFNRTSRRDCNCVLLFCAKYVFLFRRICFRTTQSLRFSCSFCLPSKSILMFDAEIVTVNSPPNASFALSEGRCWLSSNDKLTGPPSLKSGSPNYGPRATSGPRRHFVNKVRMVFLRSISSFGTWQNATYLKTITSRKMTGPRTVI